MHEHEDKDAINQVWKRHFQSEYEETAEYRPVTSRFGRHFFTSFWRFDVDAFEYEEIQYMRGDRVEKMKDRAAMDEYLHPHYDRIERKYRESVFRLNI
ncbi:hypothetical protein NDI76_02085 [Halogeometricum sp. S1BR25-6]|uniref:Uncharacterized protein n=1 Tax=Halogeometricum salsisoli TaxID=2950536 RepID=A0ABU2G9Q7_9EURY|nr:hypothetical protein [Halogeometricum sp. S1BR25-6]MDS0297530.1 hypothetical protein [Halogeometricum sp. S1BR25-6]